MAELIDRKSLHVNDLPFTQGQCQTVQDWLDMQPTVKADSVVHAHWVTERRLGGFARICSLCGNYHPGRYYSATYCDNCGALMDEVTTDE